MDKHGGIIVGFSGKMKSGKTTAASYLVAQDLEFCSRSFAGTLRSIASHVFGISDKKLLDQEFKKSEAFPGLSWRDVLIKLGAFLRSLESDFLINRLDWSGKNVTIDDCRFKNEAIKIKAMGGVMVRINRDSSPLLDDISETDLDDWDFDFVIDNNQGFDYLYSQLDEIMGIVGENSGLKLRNGNSVVGRSPAEVGGEGQEKEQGS